MQKSFRKAMLSTICMLIVAVLSLTGVTYAWFSAGNIATVDGMNMQVVASAGGLEVSTNGTTWQTSVSLSTVSKTDVYPVSTTDAENFVKLTEYNPTNTGQAKFETDTSNVITQKLYLGNTGASPLTVDLRKTNIEDKTNGKSIGDAARIAIFTVSEENRTLVGIMNPYNNVDTAETYMGIDATTATTLNWVEFGATSGNGLGSITTKTTDGVELVIPEATAENNNRGILEIEVVIWLEGQDEKCINANAAGSFNIFLQFNKTDATLD